MTNRVDELESQIAKLQATVDGLTEELVETKERVRLLEESVDVDLTTGTRSVGYDPEPEADADADANPQADATTEPETAPGGGPDPLTESQAQTASRSRASDTATDDANFIDAGSDDPTAGYATADGDGTKTDEADNDDEAVTTDDDIIVA
jgi:TolA-binding protein